MPSNIQTILREIKKLSDERPTPKFKLMAQFHLLLSELSDDAAEVTVEDLAELDQAMRKAALLALTVTMAGTLAEE